MKKLILIAISLLLSVGSSQAVTLTVDDNGPADYDNIRAALNAAVDGDTIIVADGTYKGWNNCQLNFNGKAVTLQSENGAESCIIDCQGQSQAFNFYSGEGNNTIVDGFTITNGYEFQGGAIFCSDYSSPTIANCIIQNSVSESYGGGIFCTYYSSPQINNCIIQNNSTKSDLGGGILCMEYASPTMSCCTIRNNSSNV